MKWRRATGTGFGNPACIESDEFVLRSTRGTPSAAASDLNSGISCQPVGMSIHPRHFQTAIRIGIRRRDLLQQSAGRERQGLGLCQIAESLRERLQSTDSNFWIAGESRMIRKQSEVEITNRAAYTEIGYPQEGEGKVLDPGNGEHGLLVACRVSSLLRMRRDGSEDFHRIG